MADFQMPWIRDPGFIEGSQRTKLLKLTLEVSNKASSRQVQHSIIYTLGELCQLKKVTFSDGQPSEYGCLYVLEIVVEVPESILERTKVALANRHPEVCVQVLHVQIPTYQMVADDSSHLQAGVTRKLYMKVDKSHTEEVLKEYLKSFGQIDSLKLKRHKPSSKSRNFGYVSFKSPSAAYAAMNQPLHMVAGYPIRLEQPKPYEPHKLSTSRENGRDSYQGEAAEEYIYADSYLASGQHQSPPPKTGFSYEVHERTASYDPPQTIWPVEKLAPSQMNLQTGIFSETWLEFDGVAEIREGWRQSRISKLISQRHLQEADHLLMFNALKKPQRAQEERSLRFITSRFTK